MRNELQPLFRVEDLHVEGVETEQPSGDGAVLGDDAIEAILRLDVGVGIDQRQLELCRAPHLTDAD